MGPCCSEPRRETAYTPPPHGKSLTSLRLHCLLILPQHREPTELTTQPLLEILMGQTEHTRAPSLICLFICLLNTLLCYLLSFTLPGRDQERKKEITKEYSMFILHLLFEQNHKILKVPQEKHFSPLRDSTMLEKTLFSCSYLTNILLLLIPSIYISITMKVCLCVCVCTTRCQVLREAIRLFIVRQERHSPCPRGVHILVGD